MYIGRTQVNLDQIDGFREVSKRFLYQPLEDAPQKTSDETQIPKIEKQEKKDCKVGIEKKYKDPFANKSPESEQTERKCILKGESRKVMRKHRYNRHTNQNFACSELDCGF